ncbi:uncharacterized protein LOC117600339 isoform X1 [Osmia lignaria lignaria]|uniref:uncharacterized protein LOC117600339 isoform X1 n=1 Tax=Osmia lignaria lignaria TaxID=1437193 RepID=UPI00402B7523
MIERFRLNCAHILVLSMLLHSISSYCYPEFVKDPISNSEISNYVAEEQHNKVDPLFEQIFRGPIEKRNDATDTKQSLEKDAQSYQDVDKHVRVKRENSVKKNNQKTLNEEKRSLKSNKASSRSMRSSRGLPKLPDKRSTDYDASADQDASEYAEEAEEEPAASSKSKETGYKSRQFHVGEDSDRFIDQEERSSLYDDFEPKDIAKRGISGAEDYEEIDEESLEPEEDAAIDEQESLDDEGDKKKVHGDTRVKRDHDGTKEGEVPQVPAKSEDAVSASDSSNDATNPDASLKRDVVPEGSDKALDSQSSKVDSNGQEHSKRNAAEKQEESKVNPDREAAVSKQSSAITDQTEIKNDENSKTLNQETPEAAAEKKTEEDVNLSGDKATNRLASESSGLKGSVKVEESKVADVSSPEATKVDSAAETSASKDVAKLDSSKNTEGIPQDLDGDYEKRVEEQIQRKIDSIKEEIKREIAEKQRIREIEENNAKFDELHELEDDDEEQSAESEPSEKRENLAKRSTKNSGKSRAREIADKRSTRRKKRQNDGQDKIQNVESDSSKKSVRETAKKRPSRSQLTPILRETAVQKRDNPREVILVRSERNTGKKRRRRRSKSSMLVPEQRNVKIEDNLPADVMLDSNLRDADDAKVNKDEKAIAEQDSLSEKKSGSVASLTGSGEELGPLATEYGEAFGGSRGEPGVALARFKRIKRVLRPQSSKTH